METLEIMFWLAVPVAPVISFCLIGLTLYRRRYFSRLLYLLSATLGIILIAAVATHWQLPTWVIMGYLFPSCVLIFFIIRSTYHKKPWKWWKIVKEKK